jgi:hypothetical protein
MAGADLLVDRQEAGWDVPPRDLRRRTASRPPEQLCPINTEIGAAPMASRSGTAAAAAISIRAVRLRVRTGTADDHPSIAPTTQPKRSCRTVTRIA